MSFPPPALEALATRAVTLLKQRKETVSFVETATGGLVSSTILSIPGTSAVFKGGVAAYQLAVREKWLEWQRPDKYDGPNEETVADLASSCRRQLSSTYALAESGVAGPGRPDVYRPEITGPGYCSLALVGEGLPEEGVRRTVKPEDNPVEGGKERSRGEWMVVFAEEMLKLLVDVLEEKEKGK
ncbi:hypothetical protein JCM8097_000326 [Rhodosporidiobolus ruineniae]